MPNEQTERELNNGTNQTPEQIDAANKWQSFMFGWRDGACGVSKRPVFIVDRAPDEPLRVAYETGYTTGIGARSDAQRAAAALYGHEIRILR